MQLEVKEGARRMGKVSRKYKDFLSDKAQGELRVEPILFQDG
jgi:hypothetical protein